MRFMESKTPQQKLNEILGELGTPKTLKYLQDKYHYKDDAEINSAQLEQIVEKLRGDGYVYVVDSHMYVTTKEIQPGWYIRRTFNGEIFILDGGYVTLYERVKRRRKIQNLKDWLLIFGTWVAGVAAFLLLIWQVFFSKVS